ncbi:murein DD-endopeptidase MepM/ murein hydrolase activator NlpD [Sphingobium sp. B2D3A]|uniref:M23 family metallopeptidase n=1 Tax=unclassified Sphingobium TaxID=2611147 RepID=UPI0022243066|nr:MULTISPECIES: M23 family metallopeptidase [unclassified Sphingobium]MCW2336041.1 murein DD-endopeptidase MepM/ murein hydrolase activator NlpD [Sphingobium sp. B2D3A]MCW2380508.1 murein DD-endopeptidase MepM/ murein hydrolase activator NlpD [Sphingobium sp. B2D3B]MCW2385800.1 murein DD-endopeptidase MepM/ murein hydrolase activator NlpD [Sphingobium sp. B2D3D]MCW2389369.1 murein DD-endopeptidase MepM/ murein hydrolase activator NlpD [Sphingobium sp. B11D3B]MCW2399385.1 murein DD-endopeptida
MSADKTNSGGVIARLLSLAPEREIFLRTGGRVRFIRISTRFQIVAASALAVLALLWAVGTFAILWNQASLLLERGHVARDRAEVLSQQAKVKAYRESVNDIAQDIEQRQKALDELLRSSLGTGIEEGGAGAPADGPEVSKPLSAASPEASRLEALRRHQEVLETRLAGAVEHRLAAVEKAIRSFGLDPARMAVRERGQGGPFIPVASIVADQPELRDIALLLTRLNTMEAALAAIPSGKPTAAPMTTSSYGYRRDPFNGSLAFHGGIDFRGRMGQPILAAAPGTVTFVGTKHGYGNVVEVDHGKGLSTLYAHLSGFNAKPGQKVARGTQIARMGSTGRSTGTHLHFEVHVHGAAVNPRPFLEARRDVLEVQQTAKRRVADSGNRG